VSLKKVIGAGNYMKKVLITGRNSYVGTSFEKWLMKEPDKYQVDTVDMEEESWREKDFSPYDVVFHVAGIAHITSNPKMSDLYYKVNRDLAVETAQKAKNEGVKQIVFMSSMSIYGKSSPQKKIIDQNTIPNPVNDYGKSKLYAETEIKKQESDDFKVVILRPPMIYGKDSRGNYAKLSRLAQRLPLFPNIKNHRSMIHIDNFCVFVKAMVDHEESGIFHPQNKEHINTSEMVRLIAKEHGKKIYLTGLFNPIIRLLIRKVAVINKVFSNLAYDQSMSEYEKVNYQIRDFYESIQLTEN
jgi:nucleoside-diphosphate-sugar epimerase